MDFEFTTDFKTKFLKKNGYKLMVIPSFKYVPIYHDDTKRECFSIDIWVTDEEASEIQGDKEYKHYSKYRMDNVFNKLLESKLLEL